jgi:hypothetical protein
MNFQDIFKEQGLYKASSFTQGTAFKVTENKELFTVIYKDKDDMLPEEYPTLVYAELFNKEYEKVYTRQSLFKA